MDKAALTKIMPERELIVTAWELLKNYCDYGPTAPESRTQQLLTDLEHLVLWWNERATESPC